MVGTRGFIERAFLALEQAGHPMNMGALLVFRPSDGADYADPERLRSLIAERISANPDLQAGLLERPRAFGTGRWDDTDVLSHLVVDVLPTSHGVGERDVLQARFAELSTTPLGGDAQNWWRFTLFSGLRDGRVALVETVHHALFDGLGMVALTETLLDKGAGPTPRSATAAKTEPTGTLAREVDPEVTHAWSSGTSPPRRPWLVRRARAVRGNRSGVLDTSALGNRMVSTAELHIPGGDRRTGPRPSRTALLMAASSGALRRILLEQGVPADRERLMTAVLRTTWPSASPELSGNRFSFRTAALPVGEATPEARADYCLRRAVASRRPQLGRSRGLRSFSRGSPLLAPAARFAPALLRRQRWIDVAVTHLPGPRGGGLGGFVLESVFPYVPIVPSVGVVIAALSYPDVAFVTMIYDATDLPEGCLFGDAIKDEWAKVARYAFEC